MIHGWASESQAMDFYLTLGEERKPDRQREIGGGAGREGERTERERDRLSFLLDMDWPAILKS